MEEFKINQVKMSLGKTGKPFYSQKMHNADSWTKIPKLNYEYCLKNNLSIATEIEKDSEGNIILLKYKNENSQERREREKSEIKPIIDNGEFVSLVKKTLGKDGKYYFYEASGYEKKLEEISWHRMEEKYFNFIVNEYKKFAIKKSENESGEIFYMEFKTKLKTDKTDSNSNPVETNKKGCITILSFSIAFLILIIHSIT